MTELRVAVAMGGGVSLGSFCGGALGETVRQLVENRAERYDSVRFDVFSGASAGAMSLGLMVHTLAHPDFRDRADAVLERQREAWVDRIDIRDLIPDPRMTRVNSLLDRGAVDRIASSLLGWTAGSEPVSDLLGRRVLLACTLANLNGIPVNARRAGQGDAFLDALQTTFYEDLRVFDLRLGDGEAGGGGGGPDGGEGGAPADESMAGRDTWLVRDHLERPEPWSEIAATCVAAGAFPLGFEPVALQRTRDEYGSVWPEAWSDVASFPFTFSDGGMFNNEPLGEVMNLIGWMDAEPGDFERVVVFIDPNLSGTSEDLSLDYYRELEVRDPDNTLWKLGRLFDGRDVEPRSYVERMTALVAPLAGALRGQAAFKDWLAAEKVNNRLAWRDGLRDALTELVEMLPDGAFEPGGAGAELAEGVRERLGSVLEAKGVSSVRANPSLALERERDRIEREEPGRLEGLEGWKREAVTDLFSLADQVAGLRGRKQVKVVGIGPVEGGEPVELAGDFVANFGGFFEREYRVYDFGVGRERAGKLLSSAGLLADGRQVPRRPPAPDVDPAAGTTPRTERLLERIKEVATDFLDVKFDWPLKLDKLAIRLGKGALGRAVAGVLDGGDAEVWHRYVVRLEILSAGPEDRFKLQGQGEGDSLEAVDEEDRPVIETLLFHAPETGKVKGPHITHRDGTAVLELVHDIRFQPDEHRVLALPSSVRVAELERMGYGKLVVRVDWSEMLEADEDELLELDTWEVREALAGWKAG